MHTEAAEAMKMMIVESGIDPIHPWIGLDVGGRYINGSTRALLPNTQWTGLDIKPGPDVDIVHDASTWTPDRQYDVVMSTELFEHTPVWREILETCHAALCPGGYLFTTCASTGRPVHSAEGSAELPADEYYGNVDPGDLRVELEKHFLDVHVTYQPCDVYAWARKAE